MQGDLLGRYERLHDWARLQGFGLQPVPEDLALLDEAIDRVREEHGRQPMSAAENEAG
jgi:hypothetical protein